MGGGFIFGGLSCLTSNSQLYIHHFFLRCGLQAERIGFSFSAKADTGGPRVGVQLAQQAVEVAGLLDLGELQRELLDLDPDPRLRQNKSAALTDIDIHFSSGGRWRSDQIEREQHYDMFLYK